MIEEKTEKKKVEKKIEKGKRSFFTRKEKPEQVALNFDPYDVLKFVLMTEKAVRQIEAQNKLVFIVDRRAKKPKIKQAAEAAFNSKITSVQTMIDQAGRKKAFIKFEKAGEAGEIAIRLGII
ncbi:MAG: 50S ribosomal protein L23 [Candidatus Aenigmarchaeota archaeon]|nr:50S ribosomal protein L23 [Candidatus Aenigmarchaeota archaeon]